MQTEMKLDSVQEPRPLQERTKSGYDKAQDDTLLI